jgi:uncharacterized SAM-binding protein YcdF (DUF218 family)
MEPRRLASGSIILNTYLLLLLGLVAGFLFVLPAVLNNCAQFLTVRDKLQSADAIVVLAGDSNGERLREGIKLYKAGCAPKMLLSGGPVMWRLTYAEWFKRQAIAEGVPARALLLQDKSRSTLEDARYSLPILKKNKIHSIILVTSYYHSRRAKRVFQKICTPAGISVVSWPAQESEFRPHGWWHRHEDIQIVVTEYMSLVFYLLRGY